MATRNDPVLAAESIAAIEIKQSLLEMPEHSSLEDLVRKAFSLAKGHWLIAQLGGDRESNELRAGITGVILALGKDHPDTDRLIAEHKSLARFSAALDAARAGASVDMAATIQASLDDCPNPIGILRLWHETTKS